MDFQAIYEIILVTLHKDFWGHERFVVHPVAGLLPP